MKNLEYLGAIVSAFVVVIIALTWSIISIMNGDFKELSEKQVYMVIAGLAFLAAHGIWGPASIQPTAKNDTTPAQK